MTSEAQIVREALRNTFILRAIQYVTGLRLDEILAAIEEVTE